MKDLDPVAWTPLCTSVPELAAYLLTDLQPFLGAPFAMFGHSMGALTAYETTLQLLEQGLKAPVWLGLSACEAPFAEPPAFGGTPLHTLPATALRAALDAMGGLPRAIQEGDDVWAVYEPGLRADFRLVETWRPRPAGRSRIPVPCSLFGGLNDHVVSREQLLAWAEGADDLLGEHFFPGAHFYWDRQAPAVAAQIVEEVDAAAPGLVGW